MQLMELRATTARIRQSLPEWVRNGLVPPLHNPSPLAAVLAENLSNSADHHGSRDAVHISCNVRADIGFLSDFLPPAAQPKLQQEALESLSRDEEQCVDTATDEPHPFSCWQEPSLSGQVLRRSPTPPSRIGSSLAWISSVPLQCLSNCLRSMLGSCCSGLACLTGRDNCPVPDSRD